MTEVFACQQKVFVNVAFEVKQILNLAVYGRSELQPTGGKKIMNPQVVYEGTHRWF